MILLSLLLVYDVFFVFITPFFTKVSPCLSWCLQVLDCVVSCSRPEQPNVCLDALARFPVLLR